MFIITRIFNAKSGCRPGLAPRRRIGAAVRAALHAVLAGRDRADNKKIWLLVIRLTSKLRCRYLIVQCKIWFIHNT